MPPPAPDRGLWRLDSVYSRLTVAIIFLCKILSSPPRRGNPRCAGGGPGDNPPPPLQGDPGLWAPHPHPPGRGAGFGWGPPPPRAYKYRDYMYKNSSPKCVWGGGGSSEPPPPPTSGTPGGTAGVGGAPQPPGGGAITPALLPPSRFRGVRATPLPSVLCMQPPPGRGSLPVWGGAPRGGGVPVRGELCVGDRRGGSPTPRAARGPAPRCRGPRAPR